MMTMENIEKTCFSSKCTKSTNGTLRNCLCVCMCFLHLPHTGGAGEDGVLLAGLTGLTGIETKKTGRRSACLESVCNCKSFVCV